MEGFQVQRVRIIYIGAIVPSMVLPEVAAAAICSGLAVEVKDEPETAQHEG